MFLDHSPKSVIDKFGLNSEYLKRLLAGEV